MPIPTTDPSAIAYLRVSTERQAGEERTSLTDQEAAVHALAKRLGVQVGRVFRDAGASGATVDGRPAFRALLAWCDENRRHARAPGYVLVLNDSRFGRFPDPEEAAYWRHHLSRLGWVVRFAEGDDVEGDFRTVVRAIGSVQASEYRRTLMANTRRGMKGAASQGFWTREAPYGFRRRVVHPAGAERVLELRQLKAPNEKVKLTPHLEEAAVVRWAFEAYASGEHSLGSLAAELRRRVPGRRWSRTVVNAMLRNEAYRGAVVGGRRRNGEPERYGCEDAHPAIVEPRLWAAVQARLSRNARLGAGTRSAYLLSGLLRCSLCGEGYHGGGGGRSRSRNPARTHRRFYRDAGGISGVCPGRIGTVMRHLVDDAAVHVVASTIAKPAVRRRIERAIDEALGAAPGRLGEAEAGLRAARARAQQRIDRLVAAVADGTFLAEEVAGQLEDARVAGADAEARLQGLRFARGRAKGLREERDRLLHAILDFPTLAARAEGLRLRRLLEPWLGRATFDKRTRMLTLGIQAVPAMGLLTARARGERTQAGLIVRRTSLVQPGHVAPAAELRRGRTA